MNRIYKYIIILAGIVFFTSCKDFLELDPISQVGTSSFYSSEKNIVLAINGAYQKFRNIHFYLLPRITESRSDNMNVDQTPYDFTTISMCNDDATLDVTWDMWRDSYGAISATNYVLDNIESVEFINEGRKASATGEARFLRAMAYFDLLRIFGGVPIFDHVAASAEVKTIARSTEAEMYNFLETELLKAVQELPEQWDGEDIGRATEYAARGILARIYMAQNKWSSVSEQCKAIIGSGYYSRFDNWSDIWDSDNDNGSEFVYQIQMSMESGSDDNRFNKGTIPPDISNDELPAGAAGTSWGSGIYPSDDIYDLYNANDVRRDITFQKGYATSSGGTNSVTMWVKKYCHGDVATGGLWEINWPVLRISDIYLMEAEAQNEAAYSASGEAMDILNWSRNRAGLDPLTAVDVPDQEAFRNAILEERRLEFAFENIRWYDLVRTGKAMTVVNDFLSSLTGGFTMKSHNHIFAIPNEELVRVANTEYLWQNPGY